MQTLRNKSTEAAHMATRYSAPPPISYYHNRIRKKGIQFLKSFDLNNKSVLEIGACHGFLGYIVQEEMGATEVIITDIFDTGFPLFLTGMIADKENLPFPDDRFDAVICNDVLHHGDLEKTTSEVLRVLKPGGFFLSTQEPCISSKEDEEAILKRDCSAQLAVGIVEHRPNLLQYKRAMTFFQRVQILGGYDLLPAIDKNYGGNGIIILGYK